MNKLYTLILLAFGNMTIAQTACDSLDIDVKWGSFTDSILQVNVINSSQELFSYPQFIVFDSNGDTVAVENVNFFGIGSMSSHKAEVYPGAVPGNVFSGMLNLYYSTIDSYAVCSWPMNFNLCPDTCQTFYPYLQNVGSQNVTGDAAWKILDINNMVVASGMFTLDTPISQYAFDSVCLEPAEYTYIVYNTSLTSGGQKTIGINPYYQSIGATFNDPDSAVLPFTVFEHCFTPTAIKTTKASSEINIYSSGNSIYFKDTDAIGDIGIYSLDGRKVYGSNIKSAAHAVDLSAFPSGIYIARVTNRNGTLVKKLFIE